MRAPTPAVTCSGLTFAWPDGTAVFDDFSMAVSPGRTGLIGVNGSGKSTLLRLIAGELTPAAGSVTVAGKLGYLPQNLALGAPRTRVDEALGIARVVAAVRAIEAGDASEENFARVGEDWDAEERARAAAPAAGRADEQPGHGQRPPAVGGTAVLPRSVDRGQPRLPVPPRTRPHPLAAPGRGPGGDQSTLTVRASRREWLRL